MSKGWIAVHRKIWDSCIWDSNEPFDQRSAWIDILMMANHEEKDVPVGKTVEHVEKGSFITSEMKLMDRWGWSKGRTTRFLKMLEKLHQIELQTNRRRTKINVVNYGIYQDLRTTNDTANDTASDTTNGTTGRPTNGTQTTNKQNNKEEMIYVGLLSRWNSLPAPVPKITKIVQGSTRDKLARKRIADYGMEEVFRAIDNVKRSTFLCGGGSTGWTITFDWFIRPENFQKVLDGNYTDHQAQPSTAIFTGEITDEMRERYGNKSWG